jgi:hypothetical protein
MKGAMSESADPDVAWPRIVAAIFCYQQARDLYMAQSGDATSGGEGMAMVNEVNDRGLGRKIWLLNTEGL